MGAVTGIMDHDPTFRFELNIATSPIKKLGRPGDTERPATASQKRAAAPTAAAQTGEATSKKKEQGAR